MRPRLIPTLMLGLALAGPAAARDFDWVHVEPVVGAGNPSLAASCVTLGPGGHPISARLLDATGIISLHYLGTVELEEFDATGALLWSATLTGEASVDGMAVDSQGALLLYGAYRGPLQVDATHSLPGNGTLLRAFLLKFDAARNVSWLRDPGDDVANLSGITAMAVDAQDRVWVGVDVLLDTSIRRLDAAGNFVQTIAQGNVRALSGLAFDADGTLWATGACSSGNHSFGGLQASTGFTYNVYLAKYGADGVGQWVRFVEDVTFQQPRLASDGVGNVYVAGLLFDAFDFGGIQAEGPDWVYDFFLCKVNGQGDFLWLRESYPDAYFGDAGPGVGLVLCARPDAVTFAGFSRGTVDWLGNAMPPTAYGNEDVLLLDYAADGTVLDATTAGSDWVDAGHAVVFGPDGTAYLAGTVGQNAQFGDLDFGGITVNSFLAALPAATTAVPETAAAAPRLDNHPNPFNPSTRLRYALAGPGRVRLDVFDQRGARLRTLVDTREAAGEHAVDWDGRDDAGRRLASGVYLARLESAEGSALRRLVLIR